MTDFNKILNKMMSETGINRDKAINYYKMFLDFHNQKKNILEKLILEKEQDESLKLLHQIKGSAINLRLEYLGSIISEMDQDIRDENFIKCMDAFKYSLNEITRLESQMDKCR